VEDEDDEFIPALGEYTPISAGPALADIPAALFTRGATREGVEVMQLQFPETHEFTLLRFLKAREGDVSKVPQCPCTCPFPSRTRTHTRTRNENSLGCLAQTVVTVWCRCCRMEEEKTFATRPVHMQVIYNSSTFHPFRSREGYHRAPVGNRPRPAHQLHEPCHSTTKRSSQPLAGSLVQCTGPLLG
jgi:hypothetical protein